MGTKQINRYKIISELGRGGMATVYLAHDPHFNREVAIKVLPPQFMHDPMFLGRFKREAQTIAALEHDTIVPVYDFGEADEQPFLVMRHMSGGSLAERIAKGPLSLAEVAAIVQRIGLALDEAHSKGIVHRDLKPGNILFDHHDHAFLSDFGIVKLAESTTTFTGNQMIGTPAYMSPEQAKGILDLDGRSDIYSLGVILFEMLTGQQPYRADTPMGVAIMHITEPVPSVRRVNSDLPHDWETVVTRALAKDREDRFGTAGELVMAVQTIIDRTPGPKYPASLSQKTEVLPNNNFLAKNPMSSKEFMAKYGRWLRFVIPILILLVAILWGTNRSNLFNYLLPTPTSDPSIIDLPTQTPSPIATPEPTSTQIPSRTPTIMATEKTIVEVTKTPISTTVPTATETVTSTPTATNIFIPAPELIAPAYGEYQSPITFKWRGISGATYKVTLRHKSENYMHTSDWIGGFEWTFDIPGDQFGDWEWFVTTRSGAVSKTSNFVFNPFPGIGDGASGNNPPPPTGYPPPIQPSITPEPSPYP